MMVKIVYKTISNENQEQNSETEPFEEHIKSTIYNIIIFHHNLIKNKINIRIK